jgi:hypothetical protein
MNDTQFQYGRCQTEVGSTLTCCNKYTISYTKIWKNPENPITAFGTLSVSYLGPKLKLLPVGQQQCSK